MINADTQLQAMLRGTARHLLGPRSSPRRLEELESGAPGYDIDVWAQMVDLDWLGIVSADSSGQSQGSLTDAAVIAEEIGRFVWPSPLLQTWAASLVVRAARRQSASFVRALEPQVPSALLVDTEPGSRIVATNRDGSWYLSSPPTPLAWAETAQWLVVAASAGEGVILTAVRPGTPGMSIKTVPSMDSERVALVSLDEVAVDVESTVLVGAGTAGCAIGAGRLLSASAMIGGARAVLEMTAAYTKQRKQFGVALSSFQAVRHQCADIAIMTDGAGLLVREALARLDENRPSSHKVLAAATYMAGRAYVEAVITAAELHGGTGFITEHVLPQHYRRAKAMQLRPGSERSQLDEVAGQLLTQRGEHDLLGLAGESR